MRALHESKSFVWTLLILFLLVWLYMLGVRTLVPTDEGRYAEMAREMVASNDWITTRLNGIKYFEKPPLQTWMNAITFEIFGLGEWQARLWTGLCGLLGIGMTAYAGRRVFNGRVAFYAALVLGSSFYWAGMGHINTLDMGLSGMMTVALCSLLLAQRNDANAKQQRNWMLLCWATMALAVLSKGLIGVVLPGAVLVLYTFIARDWSIWRRLHLVKGLLVFFAVATPWFVLVAQRNPEFLEFFFIHEHFQRFTSKIHSRVGPWYYFIPLMLLGILPWLGVMFQGLFNGLRKQASEAHDIHGVSNGRFKPTLMLVIWSAFIFFFFSVSSSKLPSYILPIFPSVALLIAVYLERASYKAIIWSAATLAVPCAISLAFIPRIPSLAKDSFSLPLVEAHVPWVYAAAILAFVGGVIAIRLARSQKDLAIVVLAVTSFIAGQFLFVGHDPQGRYSAGIDHVPAIQAEITPETPLYLVDQYEHAFPFYLERTFTLVRHPDEMAFGLRQEPHLWMPTIEEFVTKWTKDHTDGKKNLAIIRPSTYQTLKEQGVPMRLIGEDPRRVIVTNDPVSIPNNQLVPLSTQ
jgi:4-amino-4-deoxy-L-arabinose transferase-like glycosyltransferase